MISLDKRMNKALWHINAALELYSRLSILFPKLNNDINDEFIAPLKTSFKRAKSLFIEGRKSFNKIYSCEINSFSSVVLVNKRYFERSLVYISDTYNLFNSIMNSLKSTSVVFEINNNLKLLIIQTKNVADLLR